MSNSPIKSSESSDDSRSKLIQMRYINEDKSRTSGRHDGAYNTKMGDIDSYLAEKEEAMIKRCKMWNTLLNRFKDIYQISNDLNSEDITSPYLDQLQIIMNELLSQNNPFVSIASDYKTSKMQPFDIKANDLEHEQVTKEQGQSNNYRNFALDERYVVAVEEMCEQLKIMKATLEKQGETVLQIMSRLVTSLEDQVEDDMTMSDE